MGVDGAGSDLAIEKSGPGSGAGVATACGPALGVMLSGSDPCPVVRTDADRSSPGRATCSGAPADSRPRSSCPAPDVRSADPAEGPFPLDPAGPRTSSGLAAESSGEPSGDVGAEPAALERPPPLAPAARLFFRLGLRGGAPGLPGDLWGRGLRPGDSGLGGGSPGGRGAGSRGAGPCRSLCISSSEGTGPWRGALWPGEAAPELRDGRASDCADVLGVC